MASMFDGTTGVAGGVAAVAASALAWVARMTVKRIERLESNIGNVVTRKELNELMDARAKADEERGRDIQRLEAKIDAYQSVITSRIDRLLERRDRGR